MVVTPPYDWDLEFWGWSVHDPISCWYVYTSDAVTAKWSSSGYHNPEFDKLYKSLMEVESEEDYLAVQHALQEHFVKDIVEIVMYHGPAIGVWWADKWTGFVEEPSHIYWHGYNVKAFLYIEPVKTPTPTTVVTTVTAPTTIVTTKTTVVPTTVVTTVAGTPTTLTTEVTRTSVATKTVVTTVTAPAGPGIELIAAVAVVIVVVVVAIALAVMRRG